MKPRKPAAYLRAELESYQLAQRLRADAVPRKMFDRTEGGDVARFAEHLVHFACVKLLGIDHLSGVLLDND